MMEGRNVKKCYYISQRWIIDSLATHFSNEVAPRNFLNAFNCSSGREGLTLNGIHSSNNIFIKILSQWRVVNKEAKPSAAWISSKDKVGNSLCIFEKEYPPFNISRITYTGMRVPLITGIPSIISGFIPICLENSSILRTIWQYSDLMDDFNCTGIVYLPFLYKKDNINNTLCQENQKEVLKITYIKNYVKEKMEGRKDVIF